ncbi:MAG: TIGR00153 family protein [Gammaproteobacteria bacterium]|nr:TIGR00153 family protein [Gammaproteobacteria bacterium]
MARKSTIFSMFGQSPVRPLQEHIEKVFDCVNELTPYFEAVIAQDWDTAKDIQKKISALEGDADKLKKELRMQLPQSLFLPVSRRDLLELLSMQDKIANRAKDIAGIILGRKMVLPEKLHTNFTSFVSRCIDTVEQAKVTINELDELVETGFKGKEVKVVESLIKKLDKLESESDKLEVKLRASLFKLEKDMNPVEVMFLYQVIDWIGDLADRAERVGSRMELLLAK